ncbi:MAG: ATP-grasp domain-containing protein [Verrucomicrobiae bacterium]|nr:ATP-grasp domain-containing protein [Verrucomicrobiae bacterium]
MTAPSAIVTDGLWRKSLSAIRSLGKAGYRVTVMGDSWFTTGFWSRYTARRLLAPTAKNDPNAFGAALLAELTRNPGAVLLPMEDETVVWVRDHLADVQARARLLLPSQESLDVALDKAATISVARELNLPTPQTWTPATADELGSIVETLPCGSFVVKPRCGRGSAGVVYGERADVAFWRRRWMQFGPLVVQERIPASGRGLGVGLLFDAHGDCAAVFAHERLRQYPNTGGPSTDRRSIVAPELVNASVRLLKRLCWHGVAMVEWKVDPRDGQAKLMEINPRFWGSLELAIRAGVNFPVLYARAALGETLGPPPPYTDNVRCRWMIPGEILRRFEQPRRERESLREFCRGLPGIAEEWDVSDLRGTVATVICYAVLGLHPRYWRYLRR